MRNKNHRSKDRLNRRAIMRAGIPLLTKVRQFMTLSYSPFKIN